MRVLAALITLSFAGLSSASAQSLADVAQKESERRQATATGKSYSNRDLKPTPQAPSDATDRAEPAVTAPADSVVDAASSLEKADPATDSASDSKSDGADGKKSDVKDEAYWSKRMAELRERLDRDQTFMQALQSRVDALTSDFVNRDDPAQRGQIAGDRQKTLAELDRLRKAIEADKRSIPDLEEEARRSGVPAGWLR
jgi:hypothetical protein